MEYRYAEILLNSHRIIRAFSSDYIVGERSYVLLFVERKRSEFHDDFGSLTERLDLELFVLDHDGQIVLSLYEGLVDRVDLLNLSALIDERNDRAKDFFEAFEAFSESEGIPRDRPSRTDREVIQLGLNGSSNTEVAREKGWHFHRVERFLEKIRGTHRPRQGG